ncbi:MAG: hypothetical protein IPI67_11935 [Myxococcales bacterium]|nr:hypothetical protein [Myxococcales bacterium]
MAQDEKKSEFDTKLTSVGAEGAVAAVESAGPRAAELVEAWLKLPNAAAVAEVAERGTGAARKAARRALGVLKSRGVAVPDRPRAASLSGPKHEEVIEAWMMPPDTAGNTLLVIAASRPASRYHSAFVVLHDAQGVHRVDVMEQSASQLKQNMSKALPGAQYKPIKVPVEWVRHRIAAARKLHAERKQPEPLGFTTARSLLEPIPAIAPMHPFDDEGLELSEEDALEVAKTSAALHALPEFRGWFPTRAAVEEMLAAVGETVPPGTEPDPEQMRVALEGEIVKTTDRYFSPERRADLTRAMKDSALSILAREGEEKALEVAATIAAIDKRGLITDAPHEVGFLKGFFEKAVSLLLAQGNGSLRIPVRRDPTGTATTDDTPAGEAPAAADPAP